jgi:hypothetical protein
MVRPILVFFFGLLGAFGSEKISGFTALRMMIQQQPRTCHGPSIIALQNHISSDSSDDNGEQTPLRRILFSFLGKSVVGGALLLSSTTLQHQAAWAAPPIAVIAEELGYFPVQNKAGEVVYVPRRIQRQSSDQAIELAQKLSQAGAVMYGACKYK